MKWGADGRTKLVISCGIWRRLKFVGNFFLSSEEPRLRGSCVGVSFWLAVQLGSDGCVFFDRGGC